MKKLICLFVWFFTSMAVAFIPSSSWVIGQMAKRCKISSLTQQLPSFLGEFANCIGATEQERAALLTQYLSLAGIKVDEISLGFFKDHQIVYIIGAPEGHRVLVDKETFFPLQEIGESIDATFTEWPSAHEPKKELPVPVSGEDKQPDPVEKTDQ